MQDATRYLTSLHKPVQMQPPMCLQYTILALAATLSPERKELALAFYQRARSYVQFDEMKVASLLMSLLCYGPPLIVRNIPRTTAT